MIPFLYKLGAGVALALALLWYVTDLRHDRDRARQEAEEARSLARTAQTQAGLNTAASGALEAAQARSLNITVKAQELAHAVSVAPGADDAVPSGVLDAWSRSIDELRNEAAAARPVAGDSGEDPAGTVPEAR